MNDVFRDPTGRDLILTEDCWSDHIIQRHPEMVPFKSLLQETVETPDAIYQGKRNAATRVYKKRYPQVPGIGNGLDLLVFAGAVDNYVKSSYFAAYSIRALGDQLWPSR